MAKAAAEPTEANASLVRDRELTAMSRVCKELNTLDQQSRARVVAYLIARYVGGKVVISSEAKECESETKPS